MLFPSTVVLNVIPKQHLCFFFVPEGERRGEERRTGYKGGRGEEAWAAIAHPRHLTSHQQQLSAVNTCKAHRQVAGPGPLAAGAGAGAWSCLWHGWHASPGRKRGG